MPSKQVEDLYNALSKAERESWGKGGRPHPAPRAQMNLDATAIKQAVAHYLSRQGSAEFDYEGVALLFNSATGEFSATALERRK